MSNAENTTEKTDRVRREEVNVGYAYVLAEDGKGHYCRDIDGKMVERDLLLPSVESNMSTVSTVSDAPSFNYVAIPAAQ